MAALNNLVSWILGRKSAPAEGGATAAAGMATLSYRVAVAGLTGDTGNAVHQSLIAVLSKDHLQPVPLGKTVTILNEGSTPAAKLLATEILARDWMLDANCHVLAWGEVIGNNETLRLRVVCQQPSFDASFGWGVGQVIDVPIPIEPFAPVLLGAVLAAVVPQGAGAPKLGDTLRTIGTDVERIIDVPPVPLTAFQPAQFQTVVGLTYIRLAESTGATSWLERAGAHYAKAIEGLPAANAALQRAGAMKCLAAIQHSQGEREKTNTNIEKAIATYREMLDLYKRDVAAMEWSSTQASLGNVLMAFTKRPEAPATALTEAATAYRLALEVLSRERSPVRWGVTLNSLGLALQGLAERDGGKERLDTAVAAYKASLSVRPRETAPLLWATTQNNLGGALFLLGKWTRKAEHLKEAAESFSLAAEVYTKLNMASHVQLLRRNIGRVERLMLGLASGGGDEEDESGAQPPVTGGKGPSPAAPAKAAGPAKPSAPAKAAPAAPPKPAAKAAAPSKPAAKPAGPAKK